MRASGANFKSSLGDATNKTYQRWYVMARRTPTLWSHVAPLVDAALASMFGSFGNLFASGPKLNYDVDKDFDVRAFGVWRHARARSKVRE
jgi:hypothetical protein